MENQIVDGTNAQSEDLSKLKKMFSDYQKKQSQKKRKTSEEILAKYFVPRKTKEVFRILPPKPGRKYIEEAFFHVVTTNAAGGKKKHGTVIYCPAHNDPKVQKLDSSGEVMLDGNGKPMLIPAPCPLCEKNKTLLAKQDNSIKGIKKEDMNESQLKTRENNTEIFKDANKWQAKKFYIIRGIDKGAEKDGVKFWRFKHNFKNQGTLDKLLPILDGYVTAYNVDYTSPEKGTNFTLTMADSEFNGHTYKSLSAVIFGPPSPLHSDPSVVQQWLEDEITWRDVFLPKKAPNTSPYQFLEMVAMGTNPYWDDTDANNKRWVFPGRPDLEEAANTRNRNLDNDEDEDFEQASDLEDTPRVSVANVTHKTVGTFTEDAKDITAKTNNPPITSEEETDENFDEMEDVDSSEYDDLPF